MMAAAGLRCAFAVLLVVAASLPAVADVGAPVPVPVVLAFAQPGGGDAGGGDPGGGCADGSCSAGNLPRPGGSAGSPGSVGSGYELEAPPADTGTTAETGWFAELKKTFGFGNNAEAPGRSDPGGATDPEQEKLRHPSRPSGADGASGGAQCADGACVSSPFLPMPALIAISAVLLVLLLAVSMRLVVTGRLRRRGE